MRANSLKRLLMSVELQSLYPNQIIIVDGSLNEDTKALFEKDKPLNLEYFLVDSQHRGLTKQRNYGISKVSPNSEIVCFIDDDTELTINYFQEISATFSSDKTIVGVGGVSLNENAWVKKEPNKRYNKHFYYVHGDYVYKESTRNVVRNFLGLQSHLPSNVVPDYSNSRTCGYPIDGESYSVHLLIGMSFSFRRIVFQNIKFSTYFEGYGLYEDADYCIRALQFGKNIINTNVQIYHYHDHSGRPNKYNYGKMVVRNGWYIWHVHKSKPNFKDRLKWNAITLILIGIRFSNIFTKANKKEAFTEALGRVVGYFSLIYNKPIIK